MFAYINRTHLYWLPGIIFPIAQSRFSSHLNFTSGNAYPCSFSPRPVFQRLPDHADVTLNSPYPFMEWLFVFGGVRHPLPVLVVR
jgi:hypothetical protein